MPRLLSAAALLLAACAHRAEPGKRVRYACDEGAEMTVAYAHDGTLAVVTLGGHETPLRRVPSGHFARYEGDGYDLYTFGDTARLDIDDKRARTGCRTTTPEPLFEAPRLPRLDPRSLLPEGTEEE